jgi:hypothetical protein
MPELLSDNTPTPMVAVTSAAITQGPVSKENPEIRKKGAGFFCEETGNSSAKETGKRTGKAKGKCRASIQHDSDEAAAGELFAEQDLPSTTATGRNGKVGGSSRKRAKTQSQSTTDSSSNATAVSASRTNGRTPAAPSLSFATINNSHRSTGGGDGVGGGEVADDDIEDFDDDEDANVDDAAGKEATANDASSGTHAEVEDADDGGKDTVKDRPRTSLEVCQVDATFRQ